MTAAWGHDVVERLLSDLLGLWARLSERTVLWLRLPFLLALAAIVGHRVNLRKHNLSDTETAPPDPGATPDPGMPEAFDRDAFRMPDGSHNDPGRAWMGMRGARFGRNVPLDVGFEETGDALMSPSPRLVSNRLLARKEFVPVPYLNLLAAGWIQFMVHDWLSHGANDKTADPHMVPVADDDVWPPDRPADAPNGPMRVLPTTGGEAPPGRPVAYPNTETHWWDGSQVYGSSWARMDRMRRENGDPDGARLENGQLWLDANGLLPLDGELQEKRPGQELAGVNGNWWPGLSVLHTLFAREHNAIAAGLAAEYPDASGEWLFQKARLVNAALMAKIHTVEWTPALMDSPIGRMAMRGNYWGFAGERLRKGFGLISKSEIIAGILGTPQEHHGAPYAMTEEFAAVYRLHPMLPDRFSFRSAADDAPLFERALENASFGRVRRLYEDSSFDDVLYSLATEPPGALVLHNFPNALRALSKKPEEGVWVDLAAVDVLRDRERGVPRYNAFRKAIGMNPVTRFEDMTTVKADQELLRDVYGHPDQVDLLVGCMAEFQSDRQPEGFGFSDTAFRIFILMASRRLKSDRFYTDDYTPEVYTPFGYAWVENNGFRDVLRRHAPALERCFADARNPFFQWTRADAAGGGGR